MGSSPSNPDPQHPPTLSLTPPTLSPTFSSQSSSFSPSKMSLFLHHNTPQELSIGECITFPTTNILNYRSKEQEEKFVREKCRKLSFFADLPENKLSDIVGKFRVCLGVDQWVFKEGSNATYFFIVVEGCVQVVKNGLLIRNLGPGDYFGQMAILYDIRRSSSVRIVKEYRSRNIYYCLHKKYFLQAVHFETPQKTPSYLSLTSSYPPFLYLSITDKTHLSQKSIKIKFQQGQRILAKYDQPYALFVIESGTIRLNFRNKRSLQLAPSSKSVFGYFGSTEIYCSAVAVQECAVYAIGKNAVNSILGRKLKYLHLWNRVLYTLLASPYLVSMGLDRVEEIAHLFVFRYVRDKIKPICYAQSGIDKIYIYIPSVNSSSADSQQKQRQKQKKLTQALSSTLSSTSTGINFRQTTTSSMYPEHPNSDIIGLEQMLSGSGKYRHDLLGFCGGYYAEIDAEIFMRYMRDEEFSVCFGRQATGKCGQRGGNIERNCVDLRKEGIVKRFYEGSIVHRYRNSCLPGVETTLRKQNHLNLHYLHLVSKTPTPSSTPLHKNTTLLLSLSSKLISSIYHQCYNPTTLQLIVIKQYIRGNGIKDYIRNIGVLPILVSRFWMACAVTVLEYLHGKGIGVAGGLGFANWVVGDDGYLMFVDGNLGDFKKESMEQSKQEINNAFVINFRQLGALAYQLLLGYPPRHPLEFPPNFKNKEQKQFLSLLLQYSSEQVDTFGWSKIKQLQFFRPIDWKALANKEVEAPVVPGFMTVDCLKL